MNTTTILYALLAAGAGCCLALQATANSRFRSNLESPLYAAFFSICGTILFATLALAILRPTAPSAESIRSTQWWNWIGGPLGALIVLAGAFLTKQLGAAVFLSLMIAGQLVLSVALDHVGAMGLPQQEITWGRVVGVLLVIAGVVCIKYL
jgi:bacterial/archaeal transporter family-2 protein